MTPKKIFHFAIGPVGGAILGFISLPIIAWVFSQEDIGRMALLQVVISFSTLFFSLGFDQAYVREFHDAINKQSLLKTSVLPGFLLLLISLIICLLNGPFLSELVFSIKSTYISWLLALILSLSFLSRFLSLVLRMSERGFAFSMCQLFPKVLILIIILIYLLFDIDNSFSNLLLANTLAISLAFIIFSWNTFNEWRSIFSEKISHKQFKTMLRFGSPLILGGIAFWGLTSLDRVLLSRLSSYAELGVYSVSVSFAAAATLFQSVFSTVWAPTVYKWASKDEGYDNVVKVTRYVLLFVVLLFCIAGLLSWIIPIILPPEYYSVQWILVACLSYPLFYTLSETTVVGIGIARKSVYSLLACIFALLINLICNYFLIPIFGAAGAASSTALSFWLFLVLRTELSIIAWKPIPRLPLYTFSFLSLLGAVSGSLLQEEFSYFVYVYWSVLLIYSIYYFKVELKFVKNFIFNGNVKL